MSRLYGESDFFWRIAARFKPLNGEPGCRDVSHLDLDTLGGVLGFKPLNGEPGCRDGEVVLLRLVGKVARFQTPERGTRVSRLK